MTDQVQPQDIAKPWHRLQEMLRENAGAERLGEYLDGLQSGQAAYSLLQLDRESQRRLLETLKAEKAAGLIGELSLDQSSELANLLSPERAATIVQHMPSDIRADLLGRLADDKIKSILADMSPESAADAGRLLTYDSETAGGLMATEYLAYPRKMLVRDVLDDIKAHRDVYADYEVQYIYVTDEGGLLVGVLRLRDMLFAQQSSALADIMMSGPVSIPASMGLDKLKIFFDEERWLGVPVTDGAGRLVGLVTRQAVMKALENKQSRQLMRLGGIISGEESRSMSLFARSGRRVSWLSVNILLNVAAACVIAAFQDTIAKVVALAVFLPIISDMSGCSGHQAVAVSIRELSLGLIRPRDALKVLLKEVGVGLLNGLILGLLLCGVAVLWKGNYYFGLVIGGAMALNTIVSVSVGGIIPLLLKRFKIDPALLSGPILTTITDACGFLFVLGFATMMLPKLEGH